MVVWVYCTNVIDVDADSGKKFTSGSQRSIPDEILRIGGGVASSRSIRG